MNIILLIFEAIAYLINGIDNQLIFIIHYGLNFIIFLLTPFKEIIFLTTLDFIVRVLFSVKYSPICTVIKFSLKTLNIQTHMVNAGPKKFAAKIGFIFFKPTAYALLIKWINLPVGRQVIKKL